MIQIQETPHVTLLKIARMGHPVLLRAADPVTEFTDPALQTLIDDMIETMEDASGAGLAAPQIHVSKRIFIYRVPPSRAEGPSDPPLGPTVIINPVLTPVDDEMVLRQEGCLSIPGFLGWVPRHARVRYAGYDRHGNAVTGIASGFRANVMQHEADHLDGVLYPMRMPDLGMMGFDTEFMRYMMQPTPPPAEPHTPTDTIAQAIAHTTARNAAHQSLQSAPHIPGHNPGHNPHQPPAPEPGTPTRSAASAPPAATTHPSPKAAG